MRSGESEATVDLHTLNDSEEVTHESGVREDKEEPIKIGPS